MANANDQSAIMHNTHSAQTPASRANVVFSSARRSIPSSATPKPVAMPTPARDKTVPATPHGTSLPHETASATKRLARVQDMIRSYIATIALSIVSDC